MVLRWLLNLLKLARKKKLKNVRRIKPKIKRLIKIRKKRVKTERKKFLVSEIMTRKIISVSPSFTLEKVAQIFLSNKISGAPVLDKKFFIGEISKTDILNLVKKESLEDLTEEDRIILRKSKVAEIMKKPICIREDKSVEEARKKMEKYNIKRLLVLDKKNQLVGIITRTDLLKRVSKEEIKETISTKIDEMLKIIEKGPTDFSRLSKLLEIPENLIENWAKILEEHDLVEISYPPIGSPTLKLKSIKVAT